MAESNSETPSTVPYKLLETLHNQDAETLEEIASDAQELADLQRERDDCGE